MRRQLGIWIGILVASTAAVPVLAQLALGSTHLIVGDAGAVIWRYKADPNDENSTDKSTSNSTTPVVVSDLKPGDVVNFRIHRLLHGFTPSQGATKRLDLVVRCGEDPSAKKGAVLQELDCQSGQSKVDKKLQNDTVRLQVLQTFSDPMDFFCTQHLQAMTGKLELQK